MRPQRIASQQRWKNKDPAQINLLHLQWFGMTPDWNVVVCLWDSATGVASLKIFFLWYETETQVWVAELKLAIKAYWRKSLKIEADYAGICSNVSYLRRQAVPLGFSGAIASCASSVGCRSLLELQHPRTKENSLGSALYPHTWLCKLHVSKSNDFVTMPHCVPVKSRNKYEREEENACQAPASALPDLS